MLARCGFVQLQPIELNLIAIGEFNLKSAGKAISVIVVTALSAAESILPPPRTDMADIKWMTSHC
jgi:hypothetical protein